MNSGILVVDDDEAISAGLTRVLESQGYFVRRLNRGAGAVAAATGLAVFGLEVVIAQQPYS